MLTIRDEQMASLSEGPRSRYEDARVRHVRETFSESFEALGEDGVRSMVREGMVRAVTYRITAESDVARFIDVMLLVSADFDAVPDDSWLGQTLADKTVSGRVKMDRVWGWARSPKEPT